MIKHEPNIIASRIKVLRGLSPVGFLRPGAFLRMPGLSSDFPSEGDEELPDAEPTAPPAVLRAALPRGAAGWSDATSHAPTTKSLAH